MPTCVSCYDQPFSLCHNPVCLRSYAARLHSDVKIPIWEGYFLVDLRCQRRGTKHSTAANQHNWTTHGPTGTQGFRVVSTSASMSFSPLSLSSQRQSPQPNLNLHNPHNSYKRQRKLVTSVPASTSRFTAKLPLQNPALTQPWPIRTMARISSNCNSSSSSNLYESYYYKTNSNVHASCYAVNARTTALQGFHYSTTGAGGDEWRS